MISVPPNLESAKSSWPPTLAPRRFTSANSAPPRMNRLLSTLILSMSSKPPNLEPIMESCSPTLAPFRFTSANSAPSCMKRLLSAWRRCMSSFPPNLEPSSDKTPRAFISVSWTLASKRE